MFRKKQSRMSIIRRNHKKFLLYLVKNNIDFVLSNTRTSGSKTRSIYIKYRKFDGKHFDIRISDHKDSSKNAKKSISHTITNDGSHKFTKWDIISSIEEAKHILNVKVQREEDYERYYQMTFSRARNLFGDEKLLKMIQNNKHWNHTKSKEWQINFLNNWMKGLEERKLKWANIQKN